MHPGISVPVGYVQVSRRRGRQFTGIVEGARRSRHQFPGVFASRVRVHTVPPQHLYGLAVQGVHDAHRCVAVGDVHDVVGDIEPVREHKGAVSPRSQKLPVLVEHHHGRVFALEGVQQALGIGGHGADHGKALARRQLGPVHDRRVSVASCSYRCHYWPPPTAVSCRF